MYFKISFVERFVEYFACRKIGTVEEQSFPINCLRFNVSNLSCRRNARIIVVVLVVVFEKKKLFQGNRCFVPKNINTYALLRRRVEIRSFFFSFLFSNEVTKRLKFGR